MHTLFFFVCRLFNSLGSSSCGVGWKVWSQRWVAGGGRRGASEGGSGCRTLIGVAEGRALGGCGEKIRGWMRGWRVLSVEWGVVAAVVGCSMHSSDNQTSVLPPSRPVLLTRLYSFMMHCWTQQWHLFPMSDVAMCCKHSLSRLKSLSSEQ